MAYGEQEKESRRSGARRAGAGEQEERRAESSSTQILGATILHQPTNAAASCIMFSCNLRILIRGLQENKKILDLDQVKRPVVRCLGAAFWCQKCQKMVWQPFHSNIMGEGIIQGGHIGIHGVDIQDDQTWNR